MNRYYNNDTRGRYNRNRNGRGRGNNRNRNQRNRQDMYTLRPSAYTAYEDAPTIRPLPQDQAYKVEMRYTTILTSNSSNDTQYRTSMTSLSRAINGSGTYLDATQWATVFDMYRIVHIKWEYLPVQSPGTMQKFPILIINDIDDPDVANLASYDEATEYQNKVYRNSDEAWQYNCRIKKYSAVPNVGVATTTPCTVQDGFLDFAQNPVLGSIKMYGNSSIASTNFGRLIVTARVIMKRQR